MNPTRRTNILSTVWLMLLWSGLTCTFAADTLPVEKEDSSYNITTCTWSLQIADNMKDVLATLNLDYQICKGTKSDGFKYVGKNDVQDLRCTDGAGKRLEARVLQQRETKLEWNFPSVSSGYQHVEIHFTLKNILRKSGSHYTLDAPWTGVFRIPVQQYAVEVLFPTDFSPTVHRTTPENAEKLHKNNIWAVRTQQTPLTERAFSLEFSKEGDR